MQNEIRFELLFNEDGTQSINAVAPPGMLVEDVIRTVVTWSMEVEDLLKAHLTEQGLSAQEVRAKLDVMLFSEAEMLLSK